MPADAERIEGMRLLAAAQEYDAASICRILDGNPSLVDFADTKGRRPITEVLKRAHARDMGEEKGQELVELLVKRGADVDSKVLFCAYAEATMRIYHVLEKIYQDRNPSDKRIGDMIRAAAFEKWKERRKGPPLPVKPEAPKKCAPGL